MEMILGMAGALLSVIMFLGGSLCGWKLREQTAQKSSSPAPGQALTEAEQRKREELIREQEGFRKMMSYNAVTAYGIYKEGAKSGDQ